MRILLRRSLSIAAAIVISAGLGIGVFANSANASPTVIHTQATYVHCAVTVAKLQPHQSESRVLSEKCVPASSQTSKNGTIEPPVSISASVPLWTGYQYTNYTGSSITFYGGAPCDASGYHLDDTRPVDYGLSWGISSWQAHSSCWHTTVYYYYNHTGPYYEYQKGVWEAGQIGNATDGTYMGNHVWSVDVWNG